MFPNRISVSADQTTRMPIPPPHPPSRIDQGGDRESGLFADQQSHQKKRRPIPEPKADEIESRIDRKLDEIDRRLANARQGNRQSNRILKITLWQA